MKQDRTLNYMLNTNAEHEQMAHALLSQATSSTEITQVIVQRPLSLSDWPGNEMRYWHAGLDLYVERMPVNA